MNILLTSAGRRGYLVDYFKDAVGESGTVHVGNSELLSVAFLHADKTVITPLIYDNSYIPFLKEYCLSNDINVIIPLFDIDLGKLSSHKKEFEALGIAVIVSDEKVINICNDKWETFLFGIQNNLRVPKTYLKIEEALEDLNSKKIEFPLIIKPRWGMGSIAVFEVDNLEELLVLYNKSIKLVRYSYLKYESGRDFENCVLIQEKMIGQEYGLDVINNLSAEYQNTIVKRKYSMRSGETDCAEIVDEPILNKLGETISRQLKHIGNLDVDVFLLDSEPCILEMNARFGGGYPFSHIAGVNLPETIISWLQKKECAPELLKAHYGVLAQKDINIVKYLR